MLRIENGIRKLNPAAKIFRTVKGEIEVARILNLAAYSSIPLHLNNPIPSPSNSGHVHDASDDHHDHSPENDKFGGVSSLIIPLGVMEPTVADKLDEWLRALLWEGRLLLPDSLPPKRLEAISASAVTTEIEVLRCKGLYATPDGRMFVIQGVRMLYEIKEEDTVDLRTFEGGKLVLIGKLGEPSELISSCTLYTGAVRKV